MEREMIKNESVIKADAISAVLGGKPITPINRQRVGSFGTQFRDKKEPSEKV
jgi:hypothetical protein